MLRGPRLFFAIFFLIGGALLAVSLRNAWQTSAFIASAEKASGTVIQNVWHASSRRGGTWHPRVRFRAADGRSYTFDSDSGSRPASYEVEERVPVLYNPEKPAEARIQSFSELWLLPLIFGFLGTIFTGVAVGPPLWRRRVQRRDDWLRIHGRCVYADFERVEFNPNLRVNGRHPWRIVCRWTDPATNTLHLFYSRNFWYNPSDYITGKTLQVLVSPKNPRRYLVETSFVPKLAD